MKARVKSTGEILNLKDAYNYNIEELELIYEPCSNSNDLLERIIENQQEDIILNKKNKKDECF